MNVKDLYITKDHFNDDWSLKVWNHKVSLVVFVASWNALANILMEDIERALNENWNNLPQILDIFFVDVDKEPELANYFGVSWTPVSAIFIDWQFASHLNNPWHYIENGILKIAGLPDIHLMLQAEWLIPTDF